MKRPNPASKSKRFLDIVSYGLLNDMFCENDFSITSETVNREFKQGTIYKNMRHSRQFRKEYKKHGIIDN